LHPSNVSGRDVVGSLYLLAPLAHFARVAWRMTLLVAPDLGRVDRTSRGHSGERNRLKRGMSGKGNVISGSTVGQARQNNTVIVFSRSCQ
jgi:hypothetical protein